MTAKVSANTDTRKTTFRMISDTGSPFHGKSPDATATRNFSFFFFARMCIFCEYLFQA